MTDTITEQDGRTGSPAELAATRAAIRDDMRKRGLPAAARNAAERTLRFGDAPPTDG